jgi:superfamily II DNA or RNA helicase
MKKLVICPTRIGLTGTLRGCKTNEMVLEGLFGSVHKMISTKELMDRDQVTNLKVNMLELCYDKTDCKSVSKTKYQEEIEFLINHKKRNEFVSRLASSLKGNTLVLFNRIEHGKSLYEIIKTDKELLYVSGETDKDQRELTRTLAEKEDVIIVASLGVYSTGVNIKNLHNLIFAHPTKSKIKVLQSTGRILRKADKKSVANIYDIVDNLKHGNRENYSYKHGLERFKIYNEDNFDIDFRKINLK